MSQAPSETARACPRPTCGGTMGPLQTGELVTVDFCGGCRGIWFDAGETAAWMEMAADLPLLDASRAAAKQSGMDCSKCGAPFEELPYDPPAAFGEGDGSGDAVLLDRCTGCASLWFDAGEVPKVERIAARIGNPKSKVMRAFLQLSKAGYEVVGTATRTAP